ncbi:MAG TPA: twin-arginine translocation signal domain-containing protein, partial [Bacteroidetes bacterium]|nr:twin-arginine translocation signal domain-containing protein [Bacteroidota bacterium]
MANSVSRRQFIKSASAAAGALAFNPLGSKAFSESGPRPNILWIVSEDNDPFLGCYGDPNATTPNIDRLAREGVLYENVFSNAPVCAPARFSIITGVYATTAGTMHMRSTYRIPLQFRFFPQYLREAGYYCTNNAKEDYNTIKPEGVWDESSHKAHYKNRKPGQPFFAVFNIGLSHEHMIHFHELKDPDQLLHKPEDMRLPPYHPDLPEIRLCWANYYDAVTAMDRRVGELLKELEEAGLAEDTIVFYYSDNGGVMPRSKRFLFESGTHVPMIIRFPRKFQHLAPSPPGSRRKELVQFVDLAPTVLSLAGIPKPRQMQGRAFLGPYREPEPENVFCFRNRMDERYDMMRSVRSRRFLYIRNYMPHRIYGQHIWYLWRSPATRAWEKAYKEGRCNEIQSRFWQTKPPEELYNVEADPHNVHNLAGDPAYADVLKKMREALRQWTRANRDAGFLPGGWMMDQSRHTTPYEITHSSDYSVEDVIGTAEMASSLRSSDLPQLVERLGHRHPVVRYWAAVGCAALGEQAKEAAPHLRELLRD